MDKKTIRRSQLISPWGIGQMVNFPGDESLMICGLDAWESVYRNAGNGHEEFILREERLEMRLGVSHFRLPPDFREPGAGMENPNLKIPCIRFPQWHYCPKCGSMEFLSIYGSRQRCKGPNYTEGMSCHATTPKRRPWIIPVRFIAICADGHIEDFPFIEWVHKDKVSTPDCQLRLRAGRSSSTLSGIIITCSCGLSRTMAGAFNEKSLKDIKKCSGSRPWLGENKEKAKYCGRDLKVVQRGASNVYFPEVRSSIYIPKWNKDVHRKIVEVLEKHWDLLTRSCVNGKLNRDVFEAIAQMKKVDCNELMTAAEERISGSKKTHLRDADDSEETYRKSEYNAIISGAGGDNQDFYVKKRQPNEYGSVTKYFKSIALLHKLRETKALIGFSRWLPEDGKSLPDKRSDLMLATNIDWLPGIYVRGEGVFFEFDADKLDEWSQRDGVIKRTELLFSNYNKARQSRGLKEKEINQRYILLHTFAHILINQFSFECGYGSSALRERIYCNISSDNQMNGVLIYTASGDSEGSLGGLVRQGNPGNLENILISSLHAARWCSSDPVCIESRGQGPDSCNLAACHSCALLPETSCEAGNRILDRAMITGTLEKPEIGYFYDFDKDN